MLAQALQFLLLLLCFCKSTSHAITTWRLTGSIREY